MTDYIILAVGAVVFFMVCCGLLFGPFRQLSEK